MDIVCTDKEALIFQQIGKAAASLNMPCYLIGGFVRDKIIGRATKDIDIVCIGGVPIDDCILYCWKTI